MTWIELEGRFRELETSFQFARIDGQTGAAGEHWRIAAVSPRDETAIRFQRLAEIAGRKLASNFDEFLNDYPLVKEEQDPIRRWYKALRYIANRWYSGFYARQTDDSGNSAGFIFMGSIRQPAAASATLCLRLSSILQETDLKSSSPNDLLKYPVITAIFVSVLVIAGFEWLVYGLPWDWLKNHSNSYGLQTGFAGVIFSFFIGLFRPRWRNAWWVTALVALIVVTISLLGGPVNSK